MHSPARSFLQVGEIKVLSWCIVIANNFQEFESAGVPRTLTWTQRAECLVDRSVLVTAGHSNNNASRMNAE